MRRDRDRLGLLLAVIVPDVLDDSRLIFPGRDPDDYNAPNNSPNEIEIEMTRYERGATRRDAEIGMLIQSVL